MRKEANVGALATSRRPKMDLRGYYHAKEA